MPPGPSTVEVGLLLLVSGPLSGLCHIGPAVNQTPTGRVYLYTPAVRRYAAQIVCGQSAAGGRGISRVDEFLYGDPNIASNLPQQNRGNIPALVKRNRGAAAVRVTKLLV